VGVTWELVGLAVHGAGGGEMEYDGRVAGIPRTQSAVHRCAVSLAT
jgi:hypothetical protein